MGKPQLRLGVRPSGAWRYSPHMDPMVLPWTSGEVSGVAGGASPSFGVRMRSMIGALMIRG
jgi:hypothetical protein